MADELLDIVTERDTLTGHSLLRSVVHERELWHRVVYVCLFNDNQEMLIQQIGKPGNYYGLWDVSVAGHITAGQTPRIAARREVQEELGVSIPLREFLLLGVRKVSEPKNNEFYYTFLAKYTGRIENLTFQKEEVRGARFISQQQLRIELATSPALFVDHGKYWDYILDNAHVLFDRK